MLSNLDISDDWAPPLRSSLVWLVPI